MAQLSVESVRDVIKTLPIGYYVGRNIVVMLSEKYDTSFYSPTDDVIVISYPQLYRAILGSRAIEGTEDSEDYIDESLIRTLLYHEVSHALLTPTNLARAISKVSYKYSQLTHGEIFDAVNIFEDERIESMLRNYFMNTDFKRLNKALDASVHDFSADCYRNEFFRLVTFRDGDSDLLDKVKEGLVGYRDLNRDTEKEITYFYDFENYRLVDYVKDIVSILLEVKSRYETKKQNEDEDRSSSSTQLPQVTKIGEPEEDEAPDDLGTPDSDDTTEEETDDGMSSNSNNSPEYCPESRNSDDNEDDEDSEDEDEDEKYKGEDIDPEKVREYFKLVTDKYRNERLVQDLRRIFTTANKINKMNGSASNAYSGVFDPRSAARDDYKYFIRNSTHGNRRGMSKIKFNLFADRSGSFEYDVFATNQIINALARIEKEFSNFKFTLITCGYGETIEDNNKREHYADGSTGISSEIFEIYDKVQDKDAINFNVLMYDGSAWDSYGRYFTQKRRSDGKVITYEDPKSFSAFNHSNCLIITDPSNEIPCKAYCNRARLEVIHNGYPEKLISVLIKNLEYLVR